MNLRVACGVWQTNGLPACGIDLGDAQIASDANKEVHAMSTVNSFALWGTLAGIEFAVPIIIHLLHQRHRRRTDWAAMELLRKALVIRSGQVKLEDCSSFFYDVLF